MPHRENSTCNSHLLNSLSLMRTFIQSPSTAGLGFFIIKGINYLFLKSIIVRINYWRTLELKYKLAVHILYDNNVVSNF